VTSAAFSPDDMTILETGAQDTATISNPVPVVPVTVFHGDSRPVPGAAFS
jgi:hypothetical protein